MTIRKPKTKWLVWSAAAVVVLAVAVLLCWRLIPRTLSDVLPVNQKSANAACTVTSCRIEDGKTKNETYTLQSFSGESKHYKAVMDTLNCARYRPSVWNLVPWSQEAAASSDWQGAEMAILSVVWGREKDESAIVLIKSDGRGVTVSVNNQLFYPTDPDLLKKLAAYIRQHGEAA